MIHLLQDRLRPGQLRGVLMGLAFSIVIGTMAGSLVGWLSVPAYAPVNYLTPIVTAGPFAGLITFLVVRATRLSVG